MLLCACMECVLLCACMQCQHESNLGESWEGTASVCSCVHAWNVCSCVHACNVNMRATYRGRLGRDSISVLLCACMECVLLCACMQCQHESKGEGWEGTADRRRGGEERGERKRGQGTKEKGEGRVYRETETEQESYAELQQRQSQCRDLA